MLKTLKIIAIILAIWLIISFVEVICKNLDANSTLSGLNFFKLWTELYVDKVVQ